MGYNNNQGKVAARRGRPDHRNFNDLNCPTRQRFGIENLGKKSGLTNQKMGVGANENPGARAGATGADTSKEAHRLRGKNSRKARRSAMSQFAKAAHKRVARMMGLCLTLGTHQQEVWDGLSVVLVAHLTAEERAAIAFAALRSLDDHNAYLTASVVLFGTLDGEVVT